MENTFGPPFAYNAGVPSKKHANLLQIIIIISSGIFSSSAIATVLKAWLDNRKTKLTIQIDGESKKLEYEGHHLNQDAATIQTVLDKLSEGTAVAQPIDAVTIDLTYDEQTEEYVLEARRHQGNSMHDDEQAVVPRQSSLLKRLLPGWLYR